MIIYEAINKINGKRYIGQTIRSLSKRKESHRIYSMTNHKNDYFHSSIKKYGISSFKWKVLEKCDTKEELDEMEFHYIKQYNTFIPNGYNMTWGGDGQFIGYKPSKETRKKLSNSNKGKKRSSISKQRYRKSKMGEKNSFYGKKHTKESRKKMGRSGENHHQWKKPLSDEVKQKISQSLKGRKFSNETIEKFRILNTGENNPMYGYKYSDEELEKRSRRTWIAENINGKKEIVKVISIWCKNKNITYSTMIRTIKTGRFCKKGWKLYEQ